ncbi:MAG: nuclear transport factor 2 family protein [Terriglobales bacterium]
MHWPVKLSLLLFLLYLPLFAQDQKALVDATIRHEDASFWDAYNRCDVAKMSQFFWPDFEFYHDKGGLTVGLGPFVETLKKNLCGKPNYRLRREAIPETVKLYPLQKNGVTYGAVLSGEHYFYISDNGKPEYRDSVAKFFHIWLLKDGMWKMARAVSYEHRDAPYENTRKEVTIQPEVLNQYAGKYNASKSGALTVTPANNLLILLVGSDKKYVLHPESGNIFFTTDRDLTFEFVKAGTKVSKIVVREHGAVVEEASRE